MMPLIIASTRTACLVQRRGRGSLSSLLRCPSSQSNRSLPSATSTSSSPVINDDDDTDSMPIQYPNISPINTSLALSVHFRHPDLGMKDYEILSRATAFLLRVDPPDTASAAGDDDDAAKRRIAGRNSAFPHLQENRDVRAKLLRRQHYRYDPAGGPARRRPDQLNWLEFCPANFRPTVHVVSSSHVLSPWLWPKYYEQDWLRVVKQDHVRYSLEVWGQKGEPSEEEGATQQRHVGKLPGNYGPLAKFALNPYPIHHPNDMDIALIHLKQEDEALKHLTKLGVQSLHVPTMHEFESSTDPVFEPGEQVLFQGFEVYEANTADREKFSGDVGGEKGGETELEDDERIFHPYSSSGCLMMASPDRFLAQTKAGPLPEGLCGGPAIKLPGNGADEILTIRGVVEGIVPKDHENKELAGLASFLPSYRIREFVDFAERVMLEQIVDEDLYRRIVDLKERRVPRGTMYREGADGGVEEGDDSDDKLPKHPMLEATTEGVDTPLMDREYQEIIASLRENHTPEEVDAILATVEREREKVIKIMETEGGDLDDVIEAVTKETYEEKDRIMAEIEKMAKETVISKGEIVSSSDRKQP